jgi:PhnB protein
MTENVKAVPDGFHTIMSYLVVREAARAIEFYKQDFGAQVRDISDGPGGSIMHASLQIGDSVLMLGR